MFRDPRKLLRSFALAVGISATLPGCSSVINSPESLPDRERQAFLDGRKIGFDQGYIAGQKSVKNCYEQDNELAEELFRHSQKVMQTHPRMRQKITKDASGRIKQFTFTAPTTFPPETVDDLFLDELTRAKQHITAIRNKVDSKASKSGCSMTRSSDIKEKFNQITAHSVTTLISEITQNPNRFPLVTDEGFARFLNNWPEYIPPVETPTVSDPYKDASGLKPLTLA